MINRSLVVAAFVFVPPQGQNQLHSHSTSFVTTRTTTKLNALLRPDWLRRASRIKRIQEEKNKVVYESFKACQKALGVGKLYRCCNPSSLSSSLSSSSSSSLSLEWKEQLLNVYLNIPENEYEARDKTNIIHRLKDGEIVKSTAPKRGVWIEHDQGGWSASSIDGMTRLEPIDRTDA